LKNQPMDELTPRLRFDLEFIPFQHEGQGYLLAKDSLGLVAEGMGVPDHMRRVLVLLDGKSSLGDVQKTLVEMNGGAPVDLDTVRGILADLDEAFLLDSERYRRERDKIVAEFSALAERPCALVGKAYPEAPGVLEIWLNNIISGHAAPPPLGGAVQALVSPHIDPPVAAEAYALAFGSLAGAGPQRVVVLGTGHQMDKGLFSLSSKAYRTPLGTVRNEPDLVAGLREAGESAEGVVLAPDDFAHRSEHSVELQLLFLQHVLPKDSFTLIPILCGSVQGNLSGFSRQEFLDRAGPFLEALRSVIAEEGTRTLLVAGVDFSHIGVKFGHGCPAAELEEEATAHDRRLLELVCARDPEGFWQEAASVEDRYNVCGLLALATLLEVLPPCTGEVLDYSMWQEEVTHSAVGFAAARFVSGG
jgi:MEMO1 family protein